MSLHERLLDFAGSLATASTNAPDNYPSWSSWTYQTHMADLKEIWADIRVKLTRDVDKIEFIDRKLQEAFVAFDLNQREKGRDAIFAVYNLDVKKLR